LARLRGCSYPLAATVPPGKVDAKVAALEARYAFAPEAAVAAAPRSWRLRRSTAPQRRPRL